MEKEQKNYYNMTAGKAHIKKKIAVEEGKMKYIKENE